MFDRLDLKPALSMFLGFACAAVTTSGATGLVQEGSEYRIMPTLPGDQVHPHMSFNAAGAGYMVMHDNSVDGHGEGIRARKFFPDLSGSRWTFQVNESYQGNQRNAQVGMLSDGSAVFAWEGSTGEGERTYIRFLGADGWFRTGDLPAALTAVGAQTRPALAVLPDDSVILIWTENDRDGHMEGIFGQRFSSNGTRLGAPFQVNQYTKYQQRTPAVAALRNGHFVVTWISQEQRHSESVDIYARIFNGLGGAIGAEFRVSDNEKFCANPAVAAAEDGFRLAWSARSAGKGLESWDIESRAFNSDGSAVGPSAVVNSTTQGDQYVPEIAGIGNRHLIVWTSFGQDKADEGVFGRLVHFYGVFESDEFQVNTTSISKQMHPTVAAAGRKFVVCWTSFVGGLASFDLFAQQYASAADEQLPQPATPFAAALSQNSVSVTWPEVGAQSVAAYLIYVDNESAPIESQGGMAVISRNFWTPGSTHTVKLAYRLTDGRVSPTSAEVTVKTWAADSNGDGLPDDWQAINWGKPTNWPPPNADSDGDGATNLEEFYAGTDPTDPQSVLRLAISNRPQGLYLEWNTEPGNFYQVQITEDFSEWRNTGVARFATSLKDAVPAGQSGQVKYYRVIRMR